MTRWIALLTPLAFIACDNKEEAKPAPSTPAAVAAADPAPAPDKAKPATGKTTDPHAGLNMKNPHAGMPGMKNPHAGMPGTKNPHAGMPGMKNPHAGMPGMKNPHAGMKNPHAGGPMGGSAGPAHPKGKPVVAMGMAFMPDEGWVAEPPKNSMRLAQFKLPRAEGDDNDGEMTVIPAMGSVADNVTRWRGQFKENPEAKTTQLEGLPEGITATHVAIEGTYLHKARPMAPGPGEPRPGYAMHALILENAGTDKGSLFVKAWGPKATMDRWAASIEGAGKTVKAAKP